MSRFFMPCLVERVVPSGRNQDTGDEAKIASYGWNCEQTKRDIQVNNDLRPFIGSPLNAGLAEALTVDGLPKPVETS